MMRLTLTEDDFSFVRMENTAMNMITEPFTTLMRTENGLAR